MFSTYKLQVRIRICWGCTVLSWLILMPFIFLYWLYPPFFSSFWCMLSETLHSLALQILALLADTLIEIQEQVLGSEDEVIMLPWGLFISFPVFELNGTWEANSFIWSSRIVNGKKSMKEMLKLRKTCYVQLVPLNLKQWLVLRSIFLFYRYGYTIELYLIIINHWFNRTKTMSLMTYLVPTPLMRWPLVLYLCFVYAPSLQILIC